LVSNPTVRAEVELLAAERETAARNAAPASDAQVNALLGYGGYGRQRRQPVVVLNVNGGDSRPSSSRADQHFCTDDEMGLRSLRSISRSSRPDTAELHARREARERERGRRRALINNTNTALDEGSRDATHDARGGGGGGGGGVGGGGWGGGGGGGGAPLAYNNAQFDYKAAALRHKLRIESLWDKQGIPPLIRRSPSPPPLTPPPHQHPTNQSSSFLNTGEKEDAFAKEEENDILVERDERRYELPGRRLGYRAARGGGVSPTGAGAGAGYASNLEGLGLDAGTPNMTKLPKLTPRGERSESVLATDGTETQQRRRRFIRGGS
jgi:hypothetical protein